MSLYSAYRVYKSDFEITQIDSNNPIDTSDNAYFWTFLDLDVAKGFAMKELLERIDEQSKLLESTQTTIKVRLNQLKKVMRLKL